MNTYEFSLIFALPAEDENPEIYVDALYAAGCSDATIGIGRLGMIGLDFDREATSARAAVESAVRDIRQVIPDAILVEASPVLIRSTHVPEPARRN